LRRRFDAAGQGHVFRFWRELNAAQQAELCDQLASIDLGEVARLHASLSTKETGVDANSAEPAPYVARDAKESAKYRAIGEDLVRSGKVAAFVVAGGQGTRLGWRGPKGSYPATAVAGKPLFRVFAEQIVAVERKHGVTIPWYVMTSPLNDAETRGFFRDNNYFGLEERDVLLFQQGTMPSIDPSGKLILEDKHVVAVNPDGHGGALRALRNSGAIEDMLARGIEQLSYFQVDNPLVNVIDPRFLGLHAAHPDSSGEMSSRWSRSATRRRRSASSAPLAAGRACSSTRIFLRTSRSQRSRTVACASAPARSRFTSSRSRSSIASRSRRTSSGFRSTAR
jgi:UDP-N-acetylglucosamine/UDP-N-acetylgalactosamine diphosphorylase